MPYVKFGGTKNILDVLTKYEILGFRRLGLDQRILYRTKNLAYHERKPDISWLQSRVAVFVAHLHTQPSSYYDGVVLDSACP